MIKAINIKVYSIEEKLTLIYKYIDCIRFIYNYILDTQVDNYKFGNKRLRKNIKVLQTQCSRKYIINKKGGSYLKAGDIGKLKLKIKKFHNKIRNIKLNNIRYKCSCMFYCISHKNVLYNFVN